MPLCKNMYCIKEVKKDGDECHQCYFETMKELFMGVGLALGLILLAAVVAALAAKFL